MWVYGNRLFRLRVCSPTPIRLRIKLVRLRIDVGSPMYSILIAYVTNTCDDVLEKRFARAGNDQCLLYVVMSLIINN